LSGEPGLAGQRAPGVPGKRTWVEVVAALGVERAPAAALPRLDLRQHQPSDPSQVIQRQEDDEGYRPAEAVIVELQRIADEAVQIREDVSPEDTETLRELVTEVEDVAARCDPRERDQIDAQLATTQDEIVASFQAVAASHAGRVEQAWQVANADDRAEQRTQYQRESGWRFANKVDQDWCGMFVNAQLREAGFAGEFNQAFNDVGAVLAFFSYVADRSPMTIRPHGEGSEKGMPLLAYHEQRGSVRSWASRSQIGTEIRAGDIVTLDWGDDDNDAADHICIVASYTPPASDQPGQLVTRDGNVYPTRDSDMTTSDIAEREYAQTSGADAAPEFAGSRPMRLIGRGRPSAVDFEPGHEYPDFTGKASHTPGEPSGPVQEIQRADQGPVATADPAAAFDAAAAGAPGELPYREEMQASLGADFSSVRAYTGRDLTALGARAATRGEQVVFASSSPDKQTVAHELTHVVQSRQGRTGGAAVSDPKDASEHEARGVAAAVTAGQSASVGAAPSAAIHRQEGDGRVVPEAAQPDVPLGGNDQGFGLDWSSPTETGIFSSHYIIDENYRLPVNNSKPGSILEVYNFFALRYLSQELPEFAEEHGNIPAEDVPSLPDGRHARQRALDELNELLQARMDELIIDGFPLAAEDDRRRMFAANEHAIADTLLIPGSTRHEPTTGDDGKTDTFCNVFAFDMVTAMGGYLPRVWWTDDAIADLQTGIQPTPDRTVQQNANDLYEWMLIFGVPHFGWEALGSSEEAQRAANHGQIVIILGSTGTDAPGHVSVVMAETSDRKRPTEAETVGGELVPLQSQAGRENFATNATGQYEGQAGLEAWWQGDEFATDETERQAAAENESWWLRADGVAGVGFFVYRADRVNRGFGALSIRTPEEMGTISADGSPPLILDEDREEEAGASAAGDG
jgi:Domain of unknown function (DUF4157)